MEQNKRPQEESPMTKMFHYCNLSRLLTTYFQWHGKFCARHSVKVILASFGLTLLSTLGLLNFHWESNAIRLWIPKNSDFAHNYEYLWSNYPPNMRFHSVIFTAPDGDILQPQYIQQMYKVYQKVHDIKVEGNKTWNDFCLRLPIVKIKLSSLLGKKRRRKRQLENSFFEEDSNDDDDDGFFKNDDDDFHTKDPSVEYYPEPYCRIVEEMDTACFEFTILELWAQDGSFTTESEYQIGNLTKERILEKINSVNTSGIFMIERDFHSLLGGVEYNASHHIVKAQATLFQMIGSMNGTMARMQGVKIDNALGEWVEESTLKFESSLILTLLNLKNETLKTYVNVARSFSDIASETIFTDVSMIMVGFSIVFAYVILMLGKFSLIENRVFLSLIGLMSVGMSIVASYGICCSLGFAFSPLHNFIPFLLLGLGIDDMFVIMQSWNNFAAKRRDLSLEDKMGITLGRAGVAITVTSITDVIAFAVGATTVLPALRSFCMFCGMGILIVYFLQATWFVAWMTLDQRRIEDRRNGYVPCIRHAPVKSDGQTCGQLDFLQSFFEKYCQVLLKTPSKVFVFILTATLLSISTWGSVELRQEFDPMWFLPKDSYLSLWAGNNEKYFPSQGEKIHVFIIELQLPEELEKLDKTIKTLQDQPDILTNIDSWYLSFAEYCQTNFPDNDTLKHVNGIDKPTFSRLLTQFLFSLQGSKYRMMFRYGGDLKCGLPAPDVKMFTMEFTHRLFSGPREQVPAMNRVKDIIESGNFSGTVFPFSKGYAAWETDEVIAEELYRNLALAIGCIFLTTLALLSNLLACLQVVLCVLLTLLNVAGFMHFWGLTIETVSSTNLIISIGLCVDCPAHIAHEFLTSTGSRMERSGKALSRMGPAVLNGGFSTFLSFILLADSNSHVFETFFKIFFLVVIFALYNGLVFLPVLLSYIGPKSEISQEESVINMSEEKEMKEVRPIISIPATRHSGNEEGAETLPCLHQQTEG